MADQDKKSPQEQGQSDQFKKQDTKEEISLRVKELREQIFDQIQDDKDIDPMMIERMNQIFNDVVAAIPPDPQIPIFQRATIATTMTKLKEQATAALKNANAKQEIAEKLTGPFEEAEKKAKEEDQKKGTAQPAGPSQSQENTRLKDQQEEAQRQGERYEERR